MPEVNPAGGVGEWGGGGGWAQLELTDTYINAATDYCFPAVDKY